MKLITIKNFNNSAEAHIVRTRLENAGIPCMLFDENVAPLTGVFNQTTGTVKLKIEEKDLVRAKEILQEKF
ncbi:MAG: DUF2007 domain-containing protein [Nitrososphaeraceae archaeon]|nr:DUF2007 domain-containing protein [Nitrososphaeraceae archaeon]